MKMVSLFSGIGAFEKALINLNTQLYKMAGNSIVVNVLEALFIKIFDAFDLVRH